MAVTIHIDDKAVAAKLEALKKAAGDMTPVMNVVGRKIKTLIELGFRGKKTPWGATWEPLKSRKGTPLRDTGRLFSSLTYQVGSEGGSQFVDIGTNVKTKDGVSYPAVHQYGAKINMPARSQKIYKHLLKSGAVGRKGRFVKQSKSNSTQTASVPAHQIIIPARPFMPLKESGLALPDGWTNSIVQALRAHFEAAI